MTTPILRGSANTEDADQDLIKDTTTAEFAQDVIEASSQVPVLVDFWAPWCGPCKQLTPVLEKLVKQAKGSIKLVKMNIDEHPSVASQLRVQSIPAVYAFKDGRPVDGFMGALPESQLKAFIERLAGPDASGGIDDVLETAHEALEAGEFEEAKEVYEAILGEDEENVEAIAGIAKCYIATNNLDKAEETLSQVPAASKDASAIASANASLALARKGGEENDLTSLKKMVAENVDNLHARFDLALALNSAGDKREAMDQLFAIMEQDREWNENAAQQQLVEFFAAWGTSDSCTIEGRRRLSSLLFA